FTSSVPSNSTEYQFLDRRGKMTLFGAGNAATRFPLAKCFPGSLGDGRRGAKFTFPLLPGGKLWIAFGNLPLRGAAGGQIREPTGWTRGTPGYDVPWDVVELSDNNPGIYVDLTRVDMLGLPMRLTVYPVSRDRPWASIGERLDAYEKILRELRSNPPFNRTVVMVPHSSPRVPRIINPSHLPAFPDIFNSNAFFSGGYINAVANYYQHTPTITYGTAYKGAYCPGSWTATSDGSNFIFTEGATQYEYPLSLFTTGYVLSDNPAPGYTAGTCQYLLDKILLQELNRGVAIGTAHPDVTPSTFYPKGTINNQYACVLHNYSLHHATYAFAFDDADGQSSSLTNIRPTLVRIDIGRIPKRLPKPLRRHKVCTPLY
ncbi:MAG: hypothetical protein JO092_08835, partial [Candidatus Eremiobacteraeota bacterium]|nr:hypothetical protein [Candidatus Eremiobacteraeota bacterium]